MKHMRKWCLLPLALGIQAILFGQSDPVLSVPSDAQMVIHLNLGKLAKKMSWSSVTKHDFFQYLMKDIPLEKQAYLTDPTKLGIDFASGLWISVRQDKENRKSPDNYVLLTGFMANESQFTNMVTANNNKPASLIHQENGHFLLEGNVSLAWNTKQFVLLVSMDDEKKSDKAAEKRLPKSFYTNKIKQLVTFLYPDAQKSLFNDPRLQQLLQQDSDIRIWSDGSVDLKGKYARNDLPDGLNLGLMTKGNYKATTIDFEQGRIISTTRHWINDSLAPIMKKMYSRPMNTALLQKIPAGNTLMVMNFSMDMAGMEQFLTQSGVSKLMKKELQESNLKFEDFQEALQGDVMMAAVLPESYPDQDEESTETSRNPLTDIQLFLAATVKDEKKMKKLVDTIQYKMEIAKKRKDSIRAAQIESWKMPDSPAVWSDEAMVDSSFVEEEMIEEDSISYLSDTTAMENEEIVLDDMSFPPPPPPKEVFKPVMDISDGLFVMTFSEKSLKAFKDNKSNHEMKAFADLYGRKPMVFTLDMKTLMGFLKPLLGSKLSSREDDNPMAILDIFDKLIISGGGFKNGAIESETEIRLSDPSLNSLEMVMNFLDMFGNVANRIGKGAIIKDEELDAPKEENVYSVDDVPPPMEIKIEPSTAVDMKADFVGGEKAWAKFLKKELNTQVPAKNGAPKGRYAVVIEFVVNEDGSYADFIALTNHGFGMEEEAMRVLGTVKKWTPAMKNDKPVESVYKKEIVFVVEN